MWLKDGLNDKFLVLALKGLEKPVHHRESTPAYSFPFAPPASLRYTPSQTSERGERRPLAAAR